MSNFLRFIFHRLLPDPLPGQVWKAADGDPFNDFSLTITQVREGWCQYYVTKYGRDSVLNSKELQNLKAFYRKLNP